MALDQPPSDSPLPALEALEALPEPLMLVGGGEPGDLAARRVVFANAAARELFRIPPEGGLLASAIRRPEVLEAVEETLAHGVEAAARFDSGGPQERSWRVWSRPLMQGGRRIVLLVMHDETDARRNERMRADFLANASHELRTPLASLTGFIETLRGHAREDAAARDRFLRIMAGQAHRMGRLIDDLLSLSRIELNEHIPPAGACDLALAVADVLDAVGPLVRERSVAIETVLPPRGEAVVVGDRDQILQVVQNLIDNAAKYSAPGQALRIEVCAGLRLDEAKAGGQAAPPHLPGNWARLPILTPGDAADGERYASVRVVDRGPGIDRARLPRLSERFYRVEGQKSGERAGTGLGLAIVKHITNRHRGGLTVESAPGAGSAFTAYFPMGRTEPAEPAEPPATAAAEIAAVTKLS